MFHFKNISYNFIPKNITWLTTAKIYIHFNTELKQLEISRDSCRPHKKHVFYRTTIERRQQA